MRDRDLPDLTHDLFVIVFRELHVYDSSRPIKPWLFGIAYRVVTDYRRSARFTREVLEQPPEVADHAAGADDRLAENQARALVTAVLDRLEFDRRTVFVMHDLDEIPVPEIARVLEIAEGTAYSRLRAARAEFSSAARRLQVTTRKP